MTSKDLTAEQTAQMTSVMAQAERRGLTRVVVRLMNDPGRLSDGANRFFFMLEGYRDGKRMEARAPFDDAAGVPDALTALAEQVTGEGAV